MLNARFGALLLAGALTIFPAQAASASSLDRQPSLPKSDQSLVSRSLSVMNHDGGAVHAAGAGHYDGTDALDDARPGVNITATSLKFDSKTISISTTMTDPVDPATDPNFISGNYVLGINLAFNGDTTPVAALFVGADENGKVSAIGQNQYSGLCPATFVASGKTITITADASCFYNPGKVSYRVTYGNFTKAFAADYSEIDMAPDFGLTDFVGSKGGYWLLGQDGGVFSFGDAAFYGSTGNLKLNKPVVGMSSMPDGKGYRFVASDGGIFTYGSAGFFGSTGNLKLNQPIVGMATTPSGNGYWLVASDGGIFSFGDAKFYGSTGALKLNKPIVGMTPTASGRGYWMVASDGGIFAFGDARFMGSTGAMKLNMPITAMAVSSTGNGYHLLAADGGIFAFGDAKFYGSGANDINGKASAIVACDGGYRIVDTTGGVWEYGASYHYGDLIDLNVWPNSPIIGGAEL